MGKLRNFFEKHSYWTGPVGLVSGMCGVLGTAWAIWSTPSEGEIRLNHEVSTNRELIFSATNSGETATTLYKIELDFSKSVVLKQWILKLLPSGEYKVVEKELKPKKIVRTPHAPSGLPLLDSCGTFFIGEAPIHTDYSPLTNSCDAISGNFPCDIKPHSQVTITVQKKSIPEKLSIPRLIEKAKRVCQIRLEGFLLST